MSSCEGPPAPDLVGAPRLALLRQDLPVIDLQVFLEAQRVDSVEVRSLCRIVADTLAFSGVLVVRDPRVSSADNAAFIDMMEEYFSQPHERKMADVRASLAYQVGATPELVEVPRCKADPECLRAVSEQPAEHRATVPEGPDPKCAERRPRMCTFLLC